MKIWYNTILVQQQNNLMLQLGVNYVWGLVDWDETNEVQTHVHCALASQIIARGPKKRDIFLDWATNH